jgi:hypothetical protein
MVFGSTQPGLKPMIYHTWGEHANPGLKQWSTTLEVSMLTQGSNQWSSTLEVSMQAITPSMIYHTWGEHASHYTINVVIIAQNDPNQIMLS